ncbi:hypothetical protein J1TS3_01880 [Siminovitchia fordii]|uniref:GIY-YIG homing endonuclease n=1 Tax=Siminovitchia fordii TaxID=254759 RepID=A0ABQ4JZU0_9BACI|nr:hypothetical protein J1TS3_01880 [Siminovitchia fordii]
MGKRKSSPRLATTSAAMLLFILSPEKELLYIGHAIDHATLNRIFKFPQSHDTPKPISAIFMYLYRQ